MEQISESEYSYLISRKKISLLFAILDYIKDYLLNPKLNFYLNSFWLKQYNPKCTFYISIFKVWKLMEPKDNPKFLPK